MSERISITVPDGLGALVDGLVRESGATGEVPTLSKARVFRLLATDGANRLVEGDLDVHDGLVGPDEEVDGEALLDLVPDHVRARYLREEVKSQNWLADMKGGFEGRVRDALAERFKNGYDPEAARDVAEGYVEEARIYWFILEDDRETFEAKRDYVLERIADYREKHETTTWDFEEDWLGTFEGVEEGRTEAALARVGPQIRAIAEDRLRERHDRGREEIIDAITPHYDVPREAVAEIVDEVRRENIVADNSEGDLALEELPEDATIRTGEATDEDAEPVEVVKANGTTIELEAEND